MLCNRNIIISEIWKWLLGKLSVLIYQALDIKIPIIRVWNFYAFWASKPMNWNKYFFKGTQKYCGYGIRLIQPSQSV
jgi:hypothetical protein